MAGQHAVDIAVDNSGWQVESHRADGRCGIVAHSFQQANLFVGARKAAHLNNLPGGKMQIASP